MLEQRTARAHARARTCSMDILNGLPLGTFSMPGGKVRHSAVPFHLSTEYCHWSVKARSAHGLRQ